MLYSNQTHLNTAAKMTAMQNAAGDHPSPATRCGELLSYIRSNNQDLRAILSEIHSKLDELLGAETHKDNVTPAPASCGVLGALEDELQYYRALVQEVSGLYSRMVNL